MNYDHAREYGKHAAFKKICYEISLLMEASLSDAQKVNTYQIEYWIEIGKQDILIVLLDKVNGWMGT